MSRNPSLVFVPGAWHCAETWTKLTSILETQHKFKCVAVSLPSTKSDPAATLLDDIEATRSAITEETGQGNDVVVVVHSYGGIPGQSAVKGLAKAKSESPDLHSSGRIQKSGHVIGLVIIASGFPVSGKSFLDGFGGQPPPSQNFNYDTGFAEIIVDARELFYHDLPEQEGHEWVKKLTKQSLKTLTEGGEHTYAGWMDVPVWYLATTEDKAFPFEAQKMFVRMTRDAGGDITLREIQSSHSPMLSRPDETADIIVDAVKAFADEVKDMRG